MDGRWLILADDLTGAADCAIAFAKRGRAAAVGWGVAPVAAERPEAFSYDADSRNMTAEAAAARHAEALEALLEPGRTLFKKIDSTLRGQPAAETAAAIAHLRNAGVQPFGVFAPAFPGVGRTTIDGRVRVAGEALEATELWRRDHTYESADLVEVLASAGVTSKRVGLAEIRGPLDGLRAAFARLAATGAIAVCDAEIDEDLARIAEASLPAAPGTFFIGSAGLAHALAAVQAKPAAEPPAVDASEAGALIVVGSLAATSRRGAAALRDEGLVAHIPADPELLLEDMEGRAALGRRVSETLRAGEDVLVEITIGDALDMRLGPRLASGLADALQPAAAVMSGFAATGGETAAALLSRFGVQGIRLVDEVEPGVSLGLSMGALSVPVATKAGAFGDDQSLIRIARALRAVRQKGSFA
ncbi:four-carbon acid sugar kinase family protein [Methylopila henanensis]|uniref:Four-carbon acid sugar kinase family protein n=1 Tax=Methylopila henanensis TaxID=873516 RepID=A0ABW4K9U4_9HYPH